MDQLRGRFAFIFSRIWRKILNLAVFETQKKHGGICRIQFWEVFQVAGPQVHHIADKNGSIDSKIWFLFYSGIRATIIRIIYGIRPTMIWTIKVHQTMVSLTTLNMYEQSGGRTKILRPKTPKPKRPNVPKYPSPKYPRPKYLKSQNTQDWNSHTK